MAANSSPLEELKDVLAKAELSENRWRDSLPILRARSVATSVILQELARTPVSAPFPPRAAAVSVVVAAPSREWAENVVRELREALPPDAVVRLGCPGARLPDAPPPVFTVRGEVLLSKVSPTAARRTVLGALSSLDGLDVAYSQPIDLIVVGPGLDG